MYGNWLTFYILRLIYIKDLLYSGSAFKAYGTKVSGSTCPVGCYLQTGFAFFLQPYILEAGPAFVFDILLIRRQSFVDCRVCGTCLLSDSRRTAFDVLFEVGRLLM